MFYQVVDDAIKNSNTEIMILRYEELLNDKSLIFNFMNFIEINDEAIITKAIENSTFKEMKKKESDDQYQVSALYRSINWQKTNDSFKVRNGINYDYVNHFSRENVEYIKIRMKEMPEIFGYKGYSFP